MSTLLRFWAIFVVTIKRLFAQRGLVLATSRGGHRRGRPDDEHPDLFGCGLPGYSAETRSPRRPTPRRRRSAARPLPSCTATWAPGAAPVDWETDEAGGPIPFRQGQPGSRPCRRPVVCPLSENRFAQTVPGRKRHLRYHPGTPGLGLFLHAERYRETHHPPGRQLPGGLHRAGRQRGGCDDQRGTRHPARRAGRRDVHRPTRPSKTNRPPHRSNTRAHRRHLETHRSEGRVLVLQLAGIPRCAAGAGRDLYRAGHPLREQPGLPGESGIG